jgi:1,4-alpha-glucan branching enzyme
MKRHPGWLDEYLLPYADKIAARASFVEQLGRRLGDLVRFADAHEVYGLHECPDGGWRFREWAPGASEIFLVGDFNEWREVEEYRLQRTDGGDFEGCFPENAFVHGQHYKLGVHWRDGYGERIPACARRVVQDHATKIFSAQVWKPETPYRWEFPRPPSPKTPVIYEAHVGMAEEREGVGTYVEFCDNLLQRIADAGYNTLQLMAIAEHPYYGSFGYHVSSFFAPSSRFGTPEELKSLIDRAHGLGLCVIIDLVHSHSVRNENEGLSRQDGTDHLYFHSGPKGLHPLWDSRLFDYAKPGVLRFLLSNCRYWLTEFRLDGFRFDGVTSMLYTHHGANKNFTSYDDYFTGEFDTDAFAYLALANLLIHEVNPCAITIAEDVSGAPGLAAPVSEGGGGFDYRLSMGIPDVWFKVVETLRDEEWDIGGIWFELTRRRQEEKTISYVESHDQALVGGKTMLFKLADAKVYTAMEESSADISVDRAIALHKMMRLLTLVASGGGYLTFMGNEFGHPEWIDFPREGNGWSYKFARRQWSLRDDPRLRYRFLADFDREMLRLFTSPDRLSGSWPRVLDLVASDKVIAVERGGLFVIFNFSPHSSFTDYGVALPPGSYTLLLDSDEKRFGGFDRIMPGQRYFTFPRRTGSEMMHVANFYLPSRTAIVLERDSRERR